MAEPPIMSPLIVTPEQYQALLRLADERIAAEAKKAEHNQPEKRQTYAERLAETEERLLRGENIIVPSRYPGLTFGETRQIGTRLRHLAVTVTQCGVVQDRYTTDDEPTAKAWQVPRLPGDHDDWSWHQHAAHAATDSPTEGTEYDPSA